MPAASTASKQQPHVSGAPALHPTRMPMRGVRQRPAQHSQEAALARLLLPLLVGVGKGAARLPPALVGSSLHPQARAVQVVACEHTRLRACCHRDLLRVRGSLACKHACNRRAPPACLRYAHMTGRCAGWTPALACRISHVACRMSVVQRRPSTPCEGSTRARGQRRININGAQTRLPQPRCVGSLTRNILAPLTQKEWLKGVTCHPRALHPVYSLCNRQQGRQHVSAHNAQRCPARAAGRQQSAQQKQEQKQKQKQKQKRTANAMTCA